jgi:regulator of sigma E protease
MGFILLIIILGIVVVVHEYGHYIAAKKFGVKVEEFGFGFPPRAKKLFTRGETLFTLNWIPFGGFVKLFGENPDDANKTDADQSRNLQAKAKWKQAVILVAGVFMNFMLAGVLFSICYMTGMTMSVDPETTVAKNTRLTITAVQKDLPAAVAGIPAGAELVSLDGNTEAVQNIAAMQKYIREHEDKPVAVVYRDFGEEKTASVTPVRGAAGENLIGIGVGLDLVGEVKLPFFRAIGEGFATALRTIKLIAEFFVNYIGGLLGFEVKNPVSSNDVAGPVGIAGLARQALELGFVHLLTFIAVISANLAVLNLIPFPALDGGRLLFLGIEAVTRRKMNPNVVGWVNTIGFGLLLLLMIFVTYKDIVKLF